MYLYMCSNSSNLADNVLYFHAQMFHFIKYFIVVYIYIYINMNCDCNKSSLMLRKKELAYHLTVKTVLFLYKKN